MYTPVDPIGHHPINVFSCESVRVVSRLAEGLPVKTKAAVEPEDEGRVFDDVGHAIAVVEAAKGNLNASVRV